MTRTYTFRDSGVKPLALRLLNRTGAPLSHADPPRPRLDPERIRAAAAKRAGTEDFGGESFRDPLER